MDELSDSMDLTSTKIVSLEQVYGLSANHSGCAGTVPTENSSGFGEKEDQPDDLVPKPKRPLSAYNLFFRDERKRLLQVLKPVEAAARKSSKKGHFKIGFDDLGKRIAASWKVLDNRTKVNYEAIAQQGRRVYNEHIKVWHEQRVALGLPTRKNRKRTKAPKATQGVPSKAFKNLDGKSLRLPVLSNLVCELEPLSIDAPPPPSGKQYWEASGAARNNEMNYAGDEHFEPRVYNFHSLTSGAHQIHQGRDVMADEGSLESLQVSALQSQHNVHTQVFTTFMTNNGMRPVLPSPAFGSVEAFPTHPETSFGRPVPQESALYSAWGTVHSNAPQMMRIMNDNKDAIGRVQAFVDDDSDHLF